MLARHPCARLLERRITAESVDRDRVTLMVASAGGHLKQLLTLADRIEDLSTPLWLTYDVSQARSTLQGKPALGVHHPTTRHLGNAARNLLLARTVMRCWNVQAVVSTGAGVAVPFLAAAAARRIPAIYFESATRVTGPSLSGRILERVPRVHRYTQYEHLQANGWSYVGSVFDGFRTEPRPEPPTAGLRVLVTVGTHEQYSAFPTLIARLESILPSRAEITWQLGHAQVEPTRGSVERFLAADQFRVEVSRADHVVAHAGTGTALAVLEAGRVPVLVPRRTSRGEHVDDHQVELGRLLAERGLAVVAEVGELSMAHLTMAGSLQAVRTRPPALRLSEL